MPWSSAFSVWCCRDLRGGGGASLRVLYVITLFTGLVRWLPRILWWRLDSPSVIAACSCPEFPAACLSVPLRSDPIVILIQAHFLWPPAPTDGCNDAFPHLPCGQTAFTQTLRVVSVPIFIPMFSLSSLWDQSLFLDWALTQSPGHPLWPLP